MIFWIRRHLKHDRWFASIDQLLCSIVSFSGCWMLGSAIFRFPRSFSGRATSLAGPQHFIDLQCIKKTSTILINWWHRISPLETTSKTSFYITLSSLPLSSMSLLRLTCPSLEPKRYLPAFPPLLSHSNEHHWDPLLSSLSSVLSQ